MIIIKLQKNFTTKHKLPKKKYFKKWVNLIFAKKSGVFLITIRIVNKREIQQLNLIYRNKNNPTNVLTFTYNIILKNNVNYIGDIIICIDIIYKESKIQNKIPILHWAHITIHSVLHLLGYHHNCDTEKNKMENLEIKYMKKLKYPNPYII